MLRFEHAILEQHDGMYNYEYLYYINYNPAIRVHYVFKGDR